jgi:2-haloacid dehalogenase
VAALGYDETLFEDERRAMPHHLVREVSRREFLQRGAGTLVAGHLLVSGSTQPGPASNGSDGQARTALPKALVFDVFGTVVDWRGSVAAEVDAFAKRKGLTIDGPRFADAWRDGYAPSMNRVRTGELPWTKLDRLHRMVLDQLFANFGIAGVSDAEADELTRAWHRLHPWPDAVGGLTRLKKRFIIASLSNGNISLMTELAKHSGLPWDCVLGAELVRHYKPDPEVYQSAAEFLDLRREDVMMVAAHLTDLRAAKAVGLRTAFVARPREFGPNGTPDLKPDSSVDITATDFADLANQLGA